MSLISRKWIGGTIFLILFMTVCVGMINWRTKAMIDSAYQTCGTTETIDLKQLGLSAEQTKRVNDLQAAYRKKIVDLCQRHCDEKSKLSELLKADRIDGEAVRKSAETIARLETESERLTMDHMLAMAGAMDEKNSKIFLRKFSEEIVKTCPIVFAPEAK